MMVSEDWDPDGAVLPPGGEVPNEPRPFVNAREKPGALGEHVCGTAQDFIEGGHYDTDSPPVVYGTLGLPNCCGPAVVGSGGGASGGRAIVSFDHFTCADAAVLPFGSWVTGSALSIAGHPDEWWKWPVVAGRKYRVSFQAFTGPFGGQSWEPDCTLAVLDGLNSTTGVPFHYDYTAALSVNTVTAASCLAGGPTTYQIRVDDIT
jgi:hypothetical protein